MKLVADESIDGPIVERLRVSGFEVVAIAEVEPGLGDDEVLSLANERHAVLLTGDKDFGDLVFRMGRVSAGVILVRLSGLKPGRKAEVVDAWMQAHRGEMIGSFTVITPGGIRIRSGSG